MPDIEILLIMSGIFKITINEILSGKNILYKIANRPFEMSDIAYFVQAKEKNKEWEKRLVENDNIKNNWEWRKNNSSHHILTPIAKRIIEHGGIILELGTGPGGGLMTYILHEKHDAELIYRVLKHDGLYVSTDSIITKERLKAYPENVQKIMLEKIPYMFEDYYETSIAAGFKTVDNILQGEQNIKGDDSTPANLAEELGVEIIYTWYTRYCTK